MDGSDSLAPDKPPLTGVHKRDVTHFLICGTILAMVFSPFFLTLGMLLLAVLSLLNWENRAGRLRFFLDRAAIARLGGWRAHPALLSFTLLFFVVLLSVWGMTEPDYWIDRLRIRLPFLLLPLLFIALPPLRESDINGYLYFLLLLLTFTSIGVLLHYGWYANEIQSAIKKGQAVPVPRNHIRFSMLLALAIIGGGYLSVIAYRFRLSADRWLIPLMTIFLFVVLHLLAVRTGLLALYAAMAVLGLGYALRQKRYIWLLGMAGIMLSLPIIAYQTLPSLRAKIDYVRYDYWKHQRGEGALYADSGRIASLRTGWEIVQENPLIGTGAGGLRSAVAQKFAQQYPQYPNPLMPHNQYLYVTAATGILGLLIFLAAFFFPLFYRQHYRYPPLLGLYVMLAVIFMIEHSLENSLGAGYAAFFLLLFLSHLHTRPPHSPESPLEGKFG